MEVLPPYLLGDNDGATNSSVSVTCDVDTAVIEMAVHARWTRRLASDIDIGFRKCLAEHPSAIIMDLRYLEDSSAESSAMWLAAQRAAGNLQPPVLFVLHVPAKRPLSQRLHDIGVTRSVPVFASMDQARTAVANRGPLTERLQLRRLRPEAVSVRAARGLIDVACEAWGLPRLRYPGRLVISELVANAVQHARTDMVVTVWRRSDGFHLSVRDGSSRLPCLRHMPSKGSSAADGSGGYGLHIVGTLSAAWGAMATRDGKMVWATMRSCRSTRRS
jgi:anti-sigma regulatory factor (Ser/Thr protein kinase)